MNDDCDKCVHAEKISDTDYMCDLWGQIVFHGDPSYDFPNFHCRDFKPFEENEVSE